MITLRQLYQAFRRRWILCLVLFILFAAGGIAGAYLKKPSFESSAKLLLNTESLPLSLSRAELPQINAGRPTLEAIQTLTEILTSRELIEELVDDLGMQAFQSPPPSSALLRQIVGIVSDLSESLRQSLGQAGLISLVAPRDDLIEGLRARLIVYPVRQSEVLEVVLSWPSPDVPQRTVQRLLELFLVRIDALNALSAEQDVLTEQADANAVALQSAQARVRALQSDHGVVSPTIEIARMTERIARLEQAQDMPNAGAGRVSGRSPEPGTRMDDLLRRISALEITRAGALAQSTERSAAVREVDAQLAAAWAAHASEALRIEAALTSDRARLAELLAVEYAFIAAQRDIDLASEAYRAYRQAAADRNVMRLQQERLRIRIIDPPSQPLKPTGPSRLVFVIAGLIAALVLALLTVLAIDRLNTPPGNGRTLG